MGEEIIRKRPLPESAGMGATGDVGDDGARRRIAELQLTIGALQRRIAALESQPTAPGARRHVSLMSTRIVPYPGGIRFYGRRLSFDGSGVPTVSEESLAGDVAIAEAVAAGGGGGSTPTAPTEISITVIPTGWMS